MPFTLIAKYHHPLVGFRFAVVMIALPNGVGLVVVVRTMLLMVSMVGFAGCVGDNFGSGDHGAGLFFSLLDVAFAMR